MPAVFLVLDSLDVGGAERSTMLIAEGLRERGFRPFVVTLFRAGSLAAEARAHGIDLINLNATGVLTAVLPLRRLIRVFRPSLVHSVLLRSDVASRVAARLEGVPCVGSIVSDAYSDDRYNSLTPRKRLGLSLVQALDATTAGVLDAVVSISDAIRLRGCAARSIPIEKSVVIPRGRPTDWFQPHSPVASSYVLCVGRMVAGKGQADLIRAFEMVPAAREIGLWFAGDGPLRQELEAAAKDLPSVRFLGRRDDVPSLLAGARMVVFPSHSEGQGGVVVEAMLAGTPLLATSIPPVLEHLNEDRARLFAPGDIEDLANQMRVALAAPEEGVRRAESARKYAEAHLTASAMIDAHVAMYMRLLGGTK